MFDKIEVYLRSYLSFPDEKYYLPLSLFAVLEHCWNDCFDEVPYISVSATVKSAGKTRVLELLSFLAGEEKAILVDGSVTVAALYTEIEQKKVILIDESERLHNPHSQFRPILNGGYRRGQTVLRKLGGQNTKFSIFCPKVFAHIGDLHDTLRDRCVLVQMQRTRSEGRKEYVRQTAVEEGRTIAREIVAAISEKVETIRDSYLNYHTLYPELRFLSDRDREIWKPLFTLCRVLSPSRIPELERSAIDIATLKTLPVRHFATFKDEEERARKEEYADRLLKDVLLVVGNRDRITTAELVTNLKNLNTSPWRTYEGVGIDDISLASLLKLHGIEPKTIRVKPKGAAHSTAKGYVLSDLIACEESSALIPAEDRSRNPVTPAAAAVSSNALPTTEEAEQPESKLESGPTQMTETIKGMTNIVRLSLTKRYVVRPHPKDGFGVYEAGGSTVCLAWFATEDAARTAAGE